MIKRFLSEIMIRPGAEIVRHPEYFNALIAPGKVHISGSVALQHIICGLFIALVALFCTSPVDQATSVYDKPLPLPAELGLE